jgi:cyclophilin family peptidyl-prolyl cis-trans isomerase
VRSAKSFLALICVVLATADAQGQASRRLAILLAAENGAPTAQELATIRAGVRSTDSDTARVAIRALGHLRRPPLVVDIVPALRLRLPEVRAEAAHAIGAAFSDVDRAAPPSASVRLALTTALASLVTRLETEEEPNVRAAICETLGRLPYVEVSELSRAKQALLELAANSDGVADRLGVAKGLEALIRMSGSLQPAGTDAIALLKSLASATNVGVLDPTRSARVRRLSLEALIAAGATDQDVISKAASDPDAQVRRLAMRAAWQPSSAIEGSVREALLRKGLDDPARMVRVEVLTPPSADEGQNALLCAMAFEHIADADLHVSLAAIDRLGGCDSMTGSSGMVFLLERMVNDLTDAGQPRGWHRPAHALVALARMAPERAAAKLEQFATSSNVFLRFYAAKAAAVIRDRATLETLARDPENTVAVEASGSLARLFGPQELTPAEDDSEQSATLIEADELRRLSAPRARVTVRGLGSFDLALFTSEAPSTVLAFAKMAESGAYSGLAISRLVPNSTIETHVAVDRTISSTFGRDDAGAWPHVRGAVGFSDEVPGGRMFINLVDNPRFDHQYTVFAQVLNGLDLIDDLLEGDVIERIEILP